MGFHEIIVVRINEFPSWAIVRILSTILITYDLLDSNPFFVTFQLNNLFLILKVFKLDDPLCLLLLKVFIFLFFTWQIDRSWFLDSSRSFDRLPRFAPCKWWAHVGWLLHTFRSILDTLLQYGIHRFLGMRPFFAQIDWNFAVPVAGLLELIGYTYVVNVAGHATALSLWYHILLSCFARFDGVVQAAQRLLLGVPQVRKFFRDLLVVVVSLRNRVGPRVERVNFAFFLDSFISFQGVNVVLKMLIGVNI